MLSFIKRFKSTGILFLLMAMLVAAVNLRPYVRAIDSSVAILPAPPENAAAVNTTSTQITLTWDASPTSPANIVSYTVFYKELTDPGYPASPQITRTDSLANYSEVITVENGVTYNFIIYANDTNANASKEDCASCKATNTVLCGNAVIDSGEQCDGIEVGGALCTDYGYESGTISCRIDCLYNFDGCYSGGGGGGGGTTQDTIPPDPGIADSPEYSNGPNIEVTYSGASDSGGSGLSYVKLLYKKETGSWMNTDQTSSSSSGTFTFTPSQTTQNANYYFDLQALDNSGNISDWPTGSGDTHTIYDKQAPTIGTITVPTTANSAPIAISYTNAVDVGIAGLDHVEFWYKKGSDGTWTDSGQTEITASGSFSFEPPDGSGLYYIDLIAVDKAENKSTETAEYNNPIAFDIDPPVLGTVSAEEITDTLPINITYSGAVDIGPAGLDHVELWFKKETGGTWTNSLLTSEEPDDVFEFMATQEGGTYYFDLVLEDSFGNRSAAASMDGLISTEYTPVPEVVVPPPSAVLSNLPAAETTSTTASITVGGDNVVAYRYKLDDGTYGTETVVTTPITLSNLATGQHTISVIGKNSQGTWQEAIVATTYTWSVIQVVQPPTPPTATLTNLPPKETALTTTNITVGGENVVAYRYKLDDGTYGNETVVTAPITLSNLAVGRHTISVVGKNNEGTWQPSADATTYNWLVITAIKTTPPTAVLSNLPATQTTSTTTNITVGGENVVAYRYKLDDGTYGNETVVTAPIILSNLATSQHTISVIAKSTQDIWQASTNSTSYTWTIVTSQAPPPSTDTQHCENEIVDVDEENIDCGGADCPACIDVILQVLAQPMGRPAGVYGSNGNVNLYSSATTNLIKTAKIEMANDGEGQALVTQIPPNTYYVGLKGDAYLQKIVNNIALTENNATTSLDFTFGGTFFLIGGDVYGDNRINSFDLALMLKNYQKSNEVLDMNRDGKANAADLAMILKNYQQVGDSL